MDKSAVTPFWTRRTELHATSVGRVFWQRNRAVRTAEETVRQAPYETSYSIQHGYERDSE